MTQKQMLESMYKIIVTGNGELPLPEQVRNNRKDVNYIIERLKNMPKNWRSWLTFAVTILTFIVLLIKFYRG